MICNGLLPIDQMRDHRPSISLVCQRVPRASLEVFFFFDKMERKRGKGNVIFFFLMPLFFFFFFFNQHVYNIAIPKPASHLPADSIPTTEELLNSFARARFDFFLFSYPCIFCLFSLNNHTEVT